ncbi:MAG: 3'(2'),5'-bisphosphate nucleotidase [Candidatus Dadabacteria bacterium]|nr:MAG: 3'(2'),5'-bisphosphate nucleotidase [Candidatus Dadabacteria bacterium]
MIEKLLEIAEGASERILEVYRCEDFGIRIKADKSPLTEADLASQSLIVKELENNFSYPVLAEETPVSFEKRKKWSSFWLVDPLDGTKEFINRNGEFTVNIALIRDSIPVAGVIAAPARGLYYFAEQGKGAYRKEPGQEAVKIYNNRKDNNLIAVESRSHPSPETQKFYDRFDIKEAIKCGSALKFCRLAEGKADVYPRFVNCWEWDTAAGHCILNEAGCKLTDLKGNEFKYNKENLLNDFFIASRRDLSF